MKIAIKSGTSHFTIPIPGWLAFSPFGIRMVLRHGRRSMPFLDGVSDRDAERLIAEIGRLQKQYGSWELVRIESSNGDLVSIII